MAKLLFINRVYPPEAGATGQLLAELAEHLQARGHEVTVLAARTGAVEGDAKSSAVTVRRYGSLPGRPRSLPAKALHYLAQYPMLAIKLWSGPRQDVIVSMTDPPMQFALAALARGRAGALVHWAQDVYPEVAEELGVLRRHGLGARLLRHVAARALGRHQAVVAVGRCMMDRLGQRGSWPDGVIRRVIPNWAPLPPARPTDEAAIRRFRETVAGGPDTFIVMYSGNFGRAHPFEAMVDAARQLAETAPSVHFAMAGDGPRLAWTKEAMAGLPNVSFLPFQPWADLRVSLAAADVHLACMEPHLDGLVVPSKVYGALGVGRPCVFLGPSGSEAARFIQETGSGVVLSGATGGALAATLQQLAAGGEEAARCRRQALATAPLVAKEARLAEWTELLESMACRTV